ncbi:hypothetical protein RIR_jg32032.t1 [Rhizophagus irregularis DAOM 181602=DAOM 197198]|nr:hypothetical protein RIR_jg32032.t1 [Rhizophagus irregularis DAOM 181602=DAOM 197198]
MKPKGAYLWFHFVVTFYGKVSGFLRLLTERVSYICDISREILEEKEIKDNVLFVNHGIMIHKIVLKKMSVVKKMFSPCIMARITSQSKEKQWHNWNFLLSMPHEGCPRAFPSLFTTLAPKSPGTKSPGLNSNISCRSNHKVG